MTYEELKEKNKKLELRANLCHARQRKNEQDYKRQNAPFAALKNQRITITLRVTEETLKRLMPKSKKLAEILPIESADMFYNEKLDETYPKDIVDTKYPMVIREGQKHYLEEYGIPCWSLAALLGALPLVDLTMPQLIGTPKTLYRCMYNDNLKSHAYDNPIDAFYEMVLKLHELKML